jgi:phage replication-related protein YjqB (UPF0714/DUF867 family)
MSERPKKTQKSPEVRAQERVEKIEKAAEFLEERKALALTLTFLLSAGVHGVSAEGYEKRDEIAQGVADTVEDVEDDVIKAKRKAIKIAEELKAKIKNASFDPRRFYNSPTGQESRKSPDANPMFRALMEGREREYDLSEFYFDEEQRLNYISDDDMATAKESYEQILAGARSIRPVAH